MFSDTFISVTICMCLLNNDIKHFLLWVPGRSLKAAGPDHCSLVWSAELLYFRSTADTWGGFRNMCKCCIAAQCSLLLADFELCDSILKKKYPLHPNKDDISIFKHFAGVPFIWYLSFLFQWTSFLIKLQKLRTEAIVTPWQLYTYKMLDQHPCISPFLLAESLFWNQWLLRSGQFREWKSFCSNLAWLAKKFD